jgi:hypothetical protein
MNEFSPSVNPTHYNTIKNTIIDECDITNIRYAEIYKMTCKTTGKSYIGQCVSHILNHKRYRPYGSKMRFYSHLSEAFSNKKGQCKFLNEDIVRYNKDDFIYEILIVCKYEECDFYETQMIMKYNTIIPNGYNGTINGGGKKCITEQTVEYYLNTKYKDIKTLDKPDEEYIKPRNRDGIQIGWSVRIENKLTEFSSSKITLCEKKQLALNFIQNLRKHIKGKTSCCSGTPLEP